MGKPLSYSTASGSSVVCAPSQPRATAHAQRDVAAHAERVEEGRGARQRARGECRERLAQEADVGLAISLEESGSVVIVARGDLVHEPAVGTAAEVDRVQDPGLARRLIEGGGDHLAVEEIAEQREVEVEEDDQARLCHSRSR